MGLIEDDQFPSLFIPPTITAKPEQIETALNEVGKFCTWLERRILEWSGT